MLLARLVKLLKSWRRKTDDTVFIAEENIEVIPQVNLTRTDMDILDYIAEALAKCDCLCTCNFLRRVQSEVTKIVEYQEEQAAK